MVEIHRSLAIVAIYLMATPMISLATTTAESSTSAREKVTSASEELTTTDKGTTTTVTSASSTSSESTPTSEPVPPGSSATSKTTQKAVVGGSTPTEEPSTTSSTTTTTSTTTSTTTTTTTQPPQVSTEWEDIEETESQKLVSFVVSEIQKLKMEHKELDECQELDLSSVLSGKKLNGKTVKYSVTLKVQPQVKNTEECLQQNSTMVNMHPEICEADVTEGDRGGTEGKTLLRSTCLQVEELQD